MNYNIVKFGDAFIELESPWKMSVGLKPDTNRATCSYLEFAKLTVGTSDNVTFSFSSPAGNDVTIKNITLYDAEPIEYGAPALELGTAQVIKYRLLFTDQRFAFVDPRGGRLVGGVINPSTETPPFPDRVNTPAPQSMNNLITACLHGMGIVASGPPATTVNAPKDLKWFGTHAPTELEKLLGMCDMVFALQIDGTYAIFNRNSGSDPTIPGGMALPIATLDGADARAKTVVFASYPTQITNTLTEDDLDDGDLLHVYRDKTTNAWHDIDDCGVFGTGAAIDEMNDHFPDTPNPQDQSGCYRFVRLNPDKWDPINSPILRKTYPVAASGDSSDPDDLPPLEDIQFYALIAVQDPDTKLWTMPSDAVLIAVDRIHDGNVLGFSSRLVKLQDGVTSTADLEGNCDPIELDTDIKIRFSVGSAPWDGSQSEYIPEYFYTGFNGSPTSPAQLTSDECKTMLTDAQTIIIPVHELAAMRYGNDVTTDPVNLTALQTEMQSLASRFLLDTAKPPRILSAVGFVPWTFNGRITDVSIDQKAITTTFKMDTWFRPASSYLAQEFGRLRKSKESHPHEAQTAGKRSAQGAAASSAPVQPMVPYHPPDSNSIAVILVVDTEGCGPGYYRGQLLSPSGPIDPTSALTAGAMGTASANFVYCQNPIEVDTGTQSLVLDGSRLPRIFGGILRGSSTSGSGSDGGGLPVYMLIEPFQGKICLDSGSESGSGSGE
jgi:hypothetical protein